MNPQTSFDLFVGIDWSGAKGPRLPGIQVAVCEPGNAAPRLICSAGHWRRSDVATWLRRMTASGHRMLIGLDFAFSFPFTDARAYFPGNPISPVGYFSLWSLVDTSCPRDEEFYGGGFAENRAWAPYFSRGKLFEPRLRITELRCREAGFGQPETVFKLIGTKQVGKASLSGMRFLNRMTLGCRDYAVWPFNVESMASASVFVEIFPRAFVRRAGGGQKKIADTRMLNALLAHYESMPVSMGTLDGLGMDRKADALLSAAALRHLAPDQALWQPKDMPIGRRNAEGWIFGVP